LFELDFGNNDALENAAINIDLPACSGIFDKEIVVSLEYRHDKWSKASSRRRPSGSHIQIPDAQYRPAVP
jgi:hypothetical protein